MIESTRDASVLTIPLINVGIELQDKRSIALQLAKCGCVESLKTIGEFVKSDNSDDDTILLAELFCLSIQSKVVECFEFIHALYTNTYYPEKSYIYAYTNGMEWVQLLAKRNVPCSMKAIIHVLEDKNLECFEYMMRFCDVSKSFYISNLAASIADTNFLRVAREQGCPFVAGTLNRAVRESNVENVKYCIDHQCPWNTEACAIAAYAGRIDILVLLHERGCPWDIWTTYAAAKSGSIGCLKYAYENGCSISRITADIAEVFGNFHCRDYVINQIKSLDNIGRSAYYKSMPLFLRDNRFKEIDENGQYREDMFFKIANEGELNGLLKPIASNIRK